MVGTLAYTIHFNAEITGGLNKALGSFVNGEFTSNALTPFTKTPVHWVSTSEHPHE